MKITPRSGCECCHGRGEVYDVVDYGSTTARMYSLCDCVLDQLPEGVEEVELVPYGEADNFEEEV